MNDSNPESILPSAHKSWTSFARVDKADEDFLLERPVVIEKGQVCIVDQTDFRLQK